MAPKKSILSRIQGKSPFRPKPPTAEAADPLYPPPLPCLAFVRPRSLTTESQDFSGSDNSIFFTKLPLDLRSKIMRLAFGYWGIHVELDFDNPLLKMRAPGVTEDGLKVGTHHPMILDERSCPDSQDSGYRWGRYLPRVDKRQPKQWQWWSGICAPHVSVFDNPQLYGGHRYSIDICTTLRPKWWADMYAGDSMAAIGIMGWLLTCRQA